MFTIPGLGLGCLINLKTLFEFVYFLVFFWVLCFLFSSFSYLFWFRICLSCFGLLLSLKRVLVLVPPLFFFLFFIYLSRVLQLVHHLLPFCLKQKKRQCMQVTFLCGAFLVLE